MIIFLVYTANFIGYDVIKNMLRSKMFRFLQEYQMRLFGNANVSVWIPVYDGLAVRYLDSGYIQSLLMLGVNSIAYAVIFVKSMMWNIRQRRTDVVMLIIIISLLLVVEASLSRWYFAMPLLFRSNERLCWDGE